MQKSKKNLYLDIVLLFVLSLLPFFWLRGGYAILGHDAGLPVSPTVHFIDRLSTWTPRYGEGGDQSFAIAGFFIHGLEALIEQTHVSLSHQQAIQFSMYFFLFGLSMYFFASTLFDEDSYYPIFAALVYQFNFFVLQAWFIAERTKFTLYIALPLVLALMIKMLRKEMTPLRAAIFSAFTLFVLNGGGFLPLFGALIISGLVFVLIFFIFSNKKVAFLGLICKYVLFFGVFSLLLHSFWLVPYMYYVTNNFSASVAEAGGISGVINWLASISQNTSFINILRLQGVQEWYVNPEHPYAHIYTTFSLTTFSFLVPLIFVRGLQVNDKKNKKILLFLISLALFSIFFMAGSHPPFGWIYIQLIKFVPGFIAFRTPFYKFAPGLYVAFAPLFAYVMSRAINSKHVSFLSRNSKKLLIIILLLLYNLPFFTVDFFQYTHKLSTKVRIPEYVFDYAKHSNIPENAYKRILLLPGTVLENGVTHYKWGYWSLATLHSLLDQNMYVTSPALPSSLSSQLVVDMYSGIVSDNSYWVSLAEHLNIEKILIEKDFVSFNYKGIEITGESLEQLIERTLGAIKKTSFGEWQLYDFNSTPNVSDQYVFIDTNKEEVNVGNFVFGELSLNPSIKTSDQILDSDFLNKNGEIIFPKCNDCFLAREQSFFANGNSVFSPGSILYTLRYPFFLGENRPHSLNENPTVSLKSLYTLQSTFVRKEPYEVRKLAWDKYVEDLLDYNQNLDTYLITYERSFDGNQYLEQLYNNLVLQRDLLKNVEGLVNIEEEAISYINTKQTILGMVNSLEQLLTITQNLHQNMYSFTASESSIYDLYLFPPSTNYKDQRVDMFVDNLAFSQEFLGKNWVKMGSTYLEKGYHTIRFDDQSLKESIATISAQTNKEKNCLLFPIGELDQNLYHLEVEVKSPETEIEASFHVLSETDDAPLLPYWGLKQQFMGGSSKKFNFPFSAVNKQKYTFFACTSKGNVNDMLQVIGLHLDRIPKPIIAVSSVKSDRIMNSANVRVTHIDNTTIRLENTERARGVVTVAVPYSALWLADKETNTMPINGNLLGVEISPEISEVILTYQSQKFASWGLIISVFGVVLSVLVLFFSRKHAKNP